MATRVPRVPGAIGRVSDSKTSGKQQDEIVHLLKIRRYDVRILKEIDRMDPVYRDGVTR